jgi:hypothetical protein
MAINSPKIQEGRVTLWTPPVLTIEGGDISLAEGDLASLNGGCLGRTFAPQKVTKNGGVGHWAEGLAGREGPRSA